MVIGPEGGFSDKEVSLFLENGFKVLTIGDTVLRTETAALYCAAAIRILLLEKDSWKLKQTKPGSE
jgi:16S rRNA (uracil1498-N3)-methyltransferase